MCGDSDEVKTHIRGLRHRSVARASSCKPTSPHCFLLSQLQQPSRLRRHWQCKPHKSLPLPDANLRSVAASRKPLLNMAQSPASSPRLPSPPPMAEDQVGATSPGHMSLDELDKIGQAAALEETAARRIRPGTRAEAMHEGPPLVDFSEVSALRLLHDQRSPD